MANELEIQIQHRLMEALVEKARLTSELHRLALVAQKTTNAVLITDEENRIIWGNDGFTRITGYTLSEALGQKPGDVLQCDPFDPAAATMREFIAKGQSARMEVCAHGKTSQAYWLDIEIQPLYDDVGQLSGCILIISDVTEQVTAHRHLQESEARTRLIINTALDAVVTVDVEGLVTAWNAQAEQTFGWSATEAIGRGLDTLIVPPEFRDAHRLGVIQFLTTGQSALVGKRIEALALRKDGTTIDVELAVTAVYTNACLSFNAFIRDITASKKTQEELRYVSRLAGMAEVATGVLHNVGNVLNSVNVSATVIADEVRKSAGPNLARVCTLLRAHTADLGSYLSSDAKGSQIPAFLEMLAAHLISEQATLQREVAQLLKNIDHVKEIVAMQQRYATMVGIIEVLQPVDLLEDALHMTSGACQRHRVKIVREFAHDVPQVRADKHKVIQILINLLRNAKDACRDSGRDDRQITLRAGWSDQCVQMTVADNGVGILPEHLPRIFHHGFTTKEHGHGFGMHSSANAAHEMGGRLTVHSDGPGGGAVFVLELPVSSGMQS